MSRRLKLENIAAALCSISHRLANVKFLKLFTRLSGFVQLRM